MEFATAELDLIARSAGKQASFTALRNGESTSASVAGIKSPRALERRWKTRTCRCTVALRDVSVLHVPHGVAAKELERQLGSRTRPLGGWHEIRKYMAEVDGEIPLGGIVEADETYVGGKSLAANADAAHPARPGWWSGMAT